MDLASAVPDGLRRQVACHGKGRGREDHVPEVAWWERGLEAGPPVCCDVQLRFLILGQAAGKAGAAPDMAREHLVRAVVDRVALVLGLGFESRELLTAQLEYRDHGLSCVVGFHGRRGLVLDVLELWLRGIAGSEEGPVDERQEGDVEPPGHVRPRVDEVEPRKPVGDMVLHTDTEGNSAAFEICDLQKNIEFPVSVMQSSIYFESTINFAMSELLYTCDVYETEIP